jgi:hypothetical protein
MWFAVGNNECMAVERGTRVGERERIAVSALLLNRSASTEGNE